MARKLIIPTLAVDIAGAYSSADLIGNKLTLTSALGADNKGVLRQIVLIDQAAQNAAMTIVFFSADPTNTTFTDNAALDIHDTDALTIIGSANIAAANYKSYADNSSATVSDLYVPLEGAAGTIYGCILSGGTPTYAATSDLKLKLYIES